MTTPAIYEALSKSTSYNVSYYDSDGDKVVDTLADSLAVRNTRYYRSRPESTSQPFVEPGFRRPSNFHQFLTYVDYPDWVITVHRGDGTKWQTLEGNGQYEDDRNPVGMIPSTGSGSSTRIQYDYNSLARAQTECLNKLTKAQVELGTNLIESKSTLGMVASRATQAGRLVLNAKRGNWNAIRRQLGLKGSHVKTSRRVSDNFLEYSFGWAPLLSDIQSGVTLFREGIDYKPQIFSVVRNVNKEYEYVGRYTQATPSVQHVKHRVKLYVRMNSQAIASLRAVGLLNPAGIAWEAVPFSFVVDWFLPVGNLLDAATARCGIEFVGGYRMAFSEGSHAITLKEDSRPPFLQGSSYARFTGSSISHVKWKYYRRDRYSTLPFPMPYVRNPFSSRRVALAGALLRQLWR